MNYDHVTGFCIGALAQCVFTAIFIWWQDRQLNAATRPEESKEQAMK